MYFFLESRDHKVSESEKKRGLTLSDQTNSPLVGLLYMLTYGKFVS